MHPGAAARLLAASFAIVLALPFVPPAADGTVAPGTPGTYYFVSLPPSLAGIALSRGLELVESYDSFALVRDPSGVAGQLAAHGIEVVPADSLFTLGINGYRFDVRQGEPAIPEALRVAYAAGEAGMHLVHFRGPVKESWKGDLERLGAAVERYVPTSAFVVKMTPEVAERVAALGRVDFVAPLHPAYRIEPELLVETGVVEVKILTYRDESLNPVLAFLGRSGVPRESAGPGQPGVLRWKQAEDFGVIKARVPASLLPAIASLRGVEYIERIHAMRTDNEYMQWVHQSDVSNTRTEWNNGLLGDGQIIAVADTGIDYDHEQFRQNSSTAGGILDIQMGGTTGSQSLFNYTDMNRRKIIRYQPMSVVAEGVLWYGPGGDTHAAKDSPNDLFGCRFGHGTAVSSTAAGNDDPITIMGPGPDDGIAKNAKIYFQDIGTETAVAGCSSGWDSTLDYIPDDYADMFQPAYDNGARIHSNSWGSDNSDYDLEGRMVDLFVWEHKDFLVVFSNGNNGPGLGSVGSPAINKNGVGIGWNGNPRPDGNPCDGAQDQNDVSGSSSRGASLDGRMKPDFMAVGNGRSGMSDGNPLTSGSTTQACWGGTSYSAPAAAGGAAILRQYLTEGWWPTGTKVPENAVASPSAALMKAMLLAGARKMDSSGTGATGSWTYPNYNQGFGRYTLDDSLYFSGDAKDLWFHDFTTGLTTGQSWTVKLWVNGNTQGLRIALVYSDYAGTVAANPALVNNLNLAVTDPSGANVYKGNCWGATFAAADSRTTCATYDAVNPLEGVVFATSSASITQGAWTVAVTAANVPVGPQPFAVAAVGDLDLTYGVITLDKPEYTEGETVQIEVVDANAPAGTLDVTVTSTTESGGETVTLTPTASGSGIWRGALDLGVGVVAGDGVLQVSDGDTITASYDDASPTRTATMTATVELVYPIIQNPRATDITNSAATIRWETDVPANSTVYYGTTAALGSVATVDSGTALRFAHAVTLVNLQTDTLYYFDVCSTDRQGHTACDDHAGLHYTFRTSLKGEILLVVADASFNPDRVQSYRDALAAKKWSLNEWHITDQGMPTLAFLRNYKAVIWQVGLEQYPPFEQEAMDLLNLVSDSNPNDDDDYVDGGGRLMVSGHDIGWAMCDTANAQWASAAKCNWIKSTLKVNFQKDFTDGFPNIVGLAGDPISGSWTSTVCYSRHRDGGPGDEIDSQAAGGTSNYVWRDSDGSATPDDIAVRWLSSAANGSALAGSWTWKGKVSKVASYMFEFTGIDNPTGVTPCADNPTRRADILNRTINWLLSDTAAGLRDHPWVQVAGPNGGETFSTSPVTITWSKSVGGGLSISGQAIYFSRNGGQSWEPESLTVPGGDTSFNWNIAGLPNGKDYLVRVVAMDSGAPALNGSDDSDATFTIDRGSPGDTEGPLTDPLSPRASPNPATAGQSVTFTAIVYDNLTGNADINSASPSAEWYIDSDPGVGSGQAMTLAAAPTSPWERVTWAGNLPALATGWHDLCVRGRDEYANWGTAVCGPFYVIASGPLPPTGVTNVWATLVGGGQDVQVTWTQSASDPGPSFDHYEVHRGTTYSASGAGYAVLPAASNLPGGTTSFTDSTTAAGVTYFYVVKAVGPGGSTDGDFQVAKLAESVGGTGKALLSLPLEVQDDSVASVFQSLSPGLVSLRTYDASDTVDPWKAYQTVKSWNELTAVGRAGAYWVETTGAAEWRVAGRVPASTTVNLVAGWNFVAYGSFLDRTAATALTGIPVTQIEAFDASAGPYYLQRMGMAETMSAGNGYWLSVSSAVPWTVNN